MLYCLSHDKYLKFPFKQTKKACPFFYSNLLYEIGQDFLDILYTRRRECMETGWYCQEDLLTTLCIDVAGHANTPLNPTHIGVKYSILLNCICGGGALVAMSLFWPVYCLIRILSWNFRSGLLAVSNRDICFINAVLYYCLNIFFLFLSCCLAEKKSVTMVIAWLNLTTASHEYTLTHEIPLCV